MNNQVFQASEPRKFQYDSNNNISKNRVTDFNNNLQVSSFWEGQNQKIESNDQNRQNSNTQNQGIQGIHGNIQNYNGQQTNVQQSDVQQSNVRNLSISTRTNNQFSEKYQSYQNTDGNLTSRTPTDPRSTYNFQSFANALEVPSSTFQNAPNPVQNNPNRIQNTQLSNAHAHFDDKLGFPNGRNQHDRDSFPNNQYKSPSNLPKIPQFCQYPTNKLRNQPLPPTNMYKQICDLIYQPTFIETTQKVACNLDQLRRPNVCEHITKDSCQIYHQNHEQPDDTLASIPTKSRSLDEILTQNECTKIHFRKVYGPTTQSALGQCSFLNLCHRAQECKYIHYEQEDFPKALEKLEKEEFLMNKIRSDSDTSNDSEVNINCLQTNNLTSMPYHNTFAQWMNADIRNLDLTVLGTFNAILIDPPWDIHMELPYGTMKDEEMRKMNIGKLASKRGPTMLFLWVTGRTKEFAVDLIRDWGFAQTDVIVWLKTNQLARIVRTGRTGHWLNHGKEHCLVGLRGPPPPDCAEFDPYNQEHAEHVIREARKQGWFSVSPHGYNDVIVSQVRETSRKPDELYEVIESICPTGRKVELFGRMNNRRKGWLTIGNQLDGTELHEHELIHSYLEDGTEGGMNKSKINK